MGFFQKIFKSIVQASIPTFSYKNNQLKFLIRTDEFYYYDLGQCDKKTQHDPNVFGAYTLRNSDIHLEFLRTDASIMWNGQPRSLYEGFFKEQLKIKSMDLLGKRKEIGKYEFSTYRINDTFILHLIYIWGGQREVFIVDTQGELFSNLLTRLDENYSYEYASEEKGSVNFDISLVKNNAFSAYFTQGD